MSKGARTEAFLKLAASLGERGIVTGNGKRPFEKMHPTLKACTKLYNHFKEHNNNFTLHGEVPCYEEDTF